MSPAQRAEIKHPYWGWEGTLIRFDLHTAELVQAVVSWEGRDHEQPEQDYAFAARIANCARNLDADTAQLARLSGYRR
jgi:hypothetical protein